MRRGWLLLVLLTWGCDDDPSARDGDAEDAATAQMRFDPDAELLAPRRDAGAPADAAAADAAVEPDAAPACPGPAPQTGQRTLTVDVGGEARRATLFVPETYDHSAPTALVLNFHGYGSNMTQQIAFSQMNEDAEARGWIVVYPDGLAGGGDARQSWNAGSCCAFNDRTRDDVGFARALVQAVAEEHCVDPGRVFATGMSNGAFMAYRLACEAADLFAAVAPVAGVLGVAEADCETEPPVAVMHLHGDADPTVPYRGNASGFRSANDSARALARANDCSPAPSPGLAEGTAACNVWDECAADVEVVLCTYAGMGHCWPGQPFCPSGEPALDPAANPLMFDFFEAHARD